MVPPGLAWLDSFCASTGAALDQSMVADVRSSVNPLVYTVSVKWTEPVRRDLALHVWNLFQKWAAHNGSMPNGRVEFDERPHPLTNAVVFGLKTDVHLRERLGHPKNRHP